MNSAEGGRGREKVCGKDVVAQLAFPGVVERGNGGEQDRNPKQATGDLARDGRIGRRVKGEREDDDDQQREKEHAVDAVAVAPLDRKVLAQVGEDVTCVDHASAPALVLALRNFVKSPRAAPVARR